MADVVVDRKEGFSYYAATWLRIFFAGHLLYSSLRYFTGFEPMGRIPHPVAGPFVEAITNMGVYHIVKTIELVTGVMLLLNILVPLVLVIEMPISIVIFILNFFIVASGRQLFSGPQEVVLNGGLMLFYGRYYAPLLKFFPPPRPVWTIRREDLR